MGSATGDFVTTSPPGYCPTPPPCPEVQFGLGAGALRFAYAAGWPAEMKADGNSQPTKRVSTMLRTPSFFLGGNLHFPSTYQICIGAGLQSLHVCCGGGGDCGLSSGILGGFSLTARHVQVPSVIQYLYHIHSMKLVVYSSTFSGLAAWEEQFDGEET